VFDAAVAWPEPLLATGTDASESGLTAFVGLTGLVMTGFLALARLSQRVVEDGADGEAVATGSTRADDTAEQRVATVGGGTALARADPGATDRDPESPAGAAADEEPSTEWAGPVAADAGSELSPGALLANVALTQGLFGVLLAGGAVYFGVAGDALGLAGSELSTGPTAVATGVGLGLALWVGSELATGVADAASAGYDEGLREMLAPASAGGWALLLGVTLPIIAVVEEFIFRAAAVGATTAAFQTSPWAVAVVSSVAFALGHGAQGRVGVVVTGGLGLALAAGFVLTNSLLVVVVAHYLVNALEFAVHEGLEVSDPVWG